MRMQWLNRRQALAIGTSVASTAVFGRGEAMAVTPTRYTLDDEQTGSMDYPALHGGEGTTKIKFYGFDGASAPANFIVYDMPPGASEGVHTHYLDDRNKEGAFDEYYYIVSGEGQMLIDGKIVPVKAGDHVHTPLEVAHGIENTHPTANLKVFLTFIQRAA